MQSYLPFLLLLLALLIFAFSLRQRKQLGLPEGDVSYRDMLDGDRLRQALYDPELDLVGRPDYLIRSGSGLVPIEVKSGRTPQKPYDSHIHQLSAYCLLVQSQMGQRPAHGLIRYPEKTFKIEFTTQLEKETRRIIAEMHACLPHPDSPRSHANPARCNACGFRELCDQSL